MQNTLEILREEGKKCSLHICERFSEKIGKFKKFLSVTKK